MSRAEARYYFKRVQLVHHMITQALLEYSQSYTRWTNLT